MTQKPDGFEFEGDVTASNDVNVEGDATVQGAKSFRRARKETTSK